MPVLEFLRPYTPDLVGWFRDFGQGAANYDANGHYARIQPIFNAFSLDRQRRRGLDSCSCAPLAEGSRLDSLLDRQQRAAARAPPRQIRARPRQPVHATPAATATSTATASRSCPGIHGP